MPTIPSLNLIVLRAKDPAALVEFYTVLGCQFRREQHGNGPVHFSADLAGVILEIYPATTTAPSTSGLRLGFLVMSISKILAGLRIVNAVEPTSLPGVVTFTDPEGHHLQIMQAV